MKPMIFVDQFFAQLNCLFPEAWCIQRDAAYPASIILHMRNGTKQYIPLQVKVIWPAGVSYWDGTTDSFNTAKYTESANWMLRSVAWLDERTLCTITGIDRKLVFFAEGQSWYPIDRVTFISSQANFSEYKHEVEKRRKTRESSEESDRSEGEQAKPASQENWRERMERNYPVPEEERFFVLCEEQKPSGDSPSAEEAIQASHSA